MSRFRLGDYLSDHADQSSTAGRPYTINVIINFSTSLTFYVLFLCFLCFLCYFRVFSSCYVVFLLILIELADIDRGMDRWKTSQNRPTVGALFRRDFYRAMHFSAFARSWDRMSSVRLSVCLPVRL